MKPERVSPTAVLIATATLLTAWDGSAPVSWEEVEWCERFLAESPEGRRMLRYLRSRPGRWMLRLAERIVLPGIVAHYRNRKQRIEALCREAIAGGFRRVVVFGAGFDTLAVRLSREFPETEFVELDLPGTQAAKRRAVAASPETGSCRVRFGSPLLPLPEDGVATLVIFEGVLMYMTPADVCSLFRKLGETRLPALRLIFTHMVAWPEGEPEFRPHWPFVGPWLRAKGEPFRWAIAEDDVSEFLGRRRFALTHYFRTRELSEFPSSSPLRGENLAVCDRT